MKKVLGVALVLSLTGNCYLGVLLIKEEDKLDEAIHAEMVSDSAFRDFSYFLRKSGMTKAQLVELAREQPSQPGERSPPEATANGFQRFP